MFSLENWFHYQVVTYRPQLLHVYKSLKWYLWNYLTSAYGHSLLDRNEMNVEPWVQDRSPSFVTSSILQAFVQNLKNTPLLESKTEVYLLIINIVYSYIVYSLQLYLDMLNTIGGGGNGFKHQHQKSWFSGIVAAQ